MNKKLVFSVVGVVAVLVVASSLAVVYASPITLDELKAWFDLWHLVDWTPTKNTINAIQSTVNTISSNVVDIRDQLGGSVTYGSYSFGSGGTTEWVYIDIPNEFVYGKTVSLWVNTWQMDSGDSIEIRVYYESYGSPPSATDLYLGLSWSGDTSTPSELILNKLPVAGDLSIEFEFTNSESYTDTIYYHYIIEDN